MPLIKVNTLQGRGTAAVDLAFRLGIAEVGTYHPQLQRPDRQATRDRVKVEVATSMAKTLMDALLAVLGNESLARL